MRFKHYLFISHLAYLWVLAWYKDNFILVSFVPRVIVFRSTVGQRSAAYAQWPWSEKVGVKQSIRQTKFGMFTRCCKRLQDVQSNEMQSDWKMLLHAPFFLLFRRQVRLIGRKQYESVKFLLKDADVQCVSASGFSGCWPWLVLGPGWCCGFPWFPPMPPWLFSQWRDGLMVPCADTHHGWRVPAEWWGQLPSTPPTGNNTIIDHPLSWISHQHSRVTTCCNLPQPVFENSAMHLMEEGKRV